jgi:hypothetical protein
MTIFTDVITDTTPENAETPVDTGAPQYRHGDSNPGFRRERAAS